MKRYIVCPECKGAVFPHKRSMPLEDALANHLRLSHPSAKMNLQPQTTGATQ